MPQWFSAGPKNFDYRIDELIARDFWADYFPSSRGFLIDKKDEELSEMSQLPEPRIHRSLSRAGLILMTQFQKLSAALGDVDLSGIHWVIVGGESGHGARPMQSEWVRHLRDLCSGAGVAFFFKQWGGVRKAHTGRLLDGRTYDEFPVV